MSRLRSITLAPEPAPAYIPPRAKAVRAPAKINALGFVDSVVYPILLQLTFVGMVFGNTIDIEHQIQGASEGGLNFQIVFRLCLMMAGCACAAWGWWTRPHIRLALITIPGMALLLLCAWHLVAAPAALVWSRAFVGFFSCTSAMMVSVNVLYEVGLKRTNILAITGMCLYGLGSIGLYLVAPELATFKEVMNNVVTVERFGGLSHPNFTGRYAVVAILLTVIAIRCKHLNWKWIIPIGALSIGILIASMSRTPVVAGLIACAIVMLPLLRWTETYLLAAMASIGILIGFMMIESTIGFDFVMDQLVEKTTKTGSSDEIKTGTGRTEIWEQSIRKTSERPLFGWGVGSTPIVMEDHSGHSHNILLHPALTLGLPGGGIVLMILILNLVGAFITRHPFHAGIFTFIVVLGLVESPLLGSFPDGLCMLWFVITILPVFLKSGEPYALKPKTLSYS